MQLRQMPKRHLSESSQAVSGGSGRDASHRESHLRRGPDRCTFGCRREPRADPGWTRRTIATSVPRGCAVSLSVCVSRGCMYTFCRKFLQLGSQAQGTQLPYTRRMPRRWDGMRTRRPVASVLVRSTYGDEAVRVLESESSSPPYKIHTGQQQYKARDRACWLARPARSAHVAPRISAVSSAHVQTHRPALYYGAGTLAEEALEFLLLQCRLSS